jgi:L-ascorbate metabolism protein UlaG (beta-lactamase superfamily)
MIDMRGNKITYFGHATFSLTTRSGQVALIDPFVMSNPACPEALKKVPRLDVILISHAHGDHIADLLPLARQH